MNLGAPRRFLAAAINEIYSQLGQGSQGRPGSILFIVANGGRLKGGREGAIPQANFKANCLRFCLGLIKQFAEHKRTGYVLSEVGGEAVSRLDCNK